MLKRNGASLRIMAGYGQYSYLDGSWMGSLRYGEVTLTQTRPDLRAAESGSDVAILVAETATAPSLMFQ
jgi:hypothetical protein